MVTVFLRLIFIYLFTILAIRLMGKRQVGELQMSELVCAFFLSELASYPVTDASIPVTYGILPALALIALEVILSFLTTKIPFLKRLLDSGPSVLIRKGEIDQTELLNNRMTAEELLSQLRLKGTGDLNAVDYALLEPNGQLSVLEKPEEKRPRAGGFQHLLIADGEIKRKGLSRAGLDRAALKALCAAHGYAQKDLFLLCIDDAGEPVFVPKARK